ncbi:MAG TPA: SEC-C metal-binding domain-containing protein [Candidatus Binatia bacterium]|nr:SEC-C metal-binding domain-containing protein [Candidatus Binatia bacterium]
MNSVGRNEPCPCGSGVKFKKCCLTSETLTNNSLRSLKYLDRTKADASIE